MRPRLVCCGCDVFEVVGEGGGGLGKRDSDSTRQHPSHPRERTHPHAAGQHTATASHHTMHTSHKGRTLTHTHTDGGGLRPCG